MDSDEIGGLPVPDPVTIPPRMHFNVRDENDIPWAICGRTPPMDATRERAAVNCGRCLRRLREDDEATERSAEWQSPTLLPPDTRGPIEKALGLLAVRYGSDSSPIVEARAELARLRTPAPQPDPRIEAWRGLDAAEREITAVMLRGFGFGTRSSWPTEAGCEIAAAALEALGEGK